MDDYKQGNERQLTTIGGNFIISKKAIFYSLLMLLLFLSLFYLQTLAAAGLESPPFCLGWPHLHHQYNPLIKLYVFCQIDQQTIVFLFCTFNSSYSFLDLEHHIGYISKNHHHRRTNHHLLYQRHSFFFIFMIAIFSQ